MNKSVIIIAFLVVGAFFTAQAQESVATRTKVADTRQVTQRARIAEGRQSGELTHREARALNAQQRNIRRTKQRAKADGVVTKSEKRQINRKQRRANRTIRQQKNDAQSRG